MLGADVAVLASEVPGTSLISNKPGRKVKADAKAKRNPGALKRPLEQIALGVYVQQCTPQIPDGVQCIHHPHCSEVEAFSLSALTLDIDPGLWTRLSRLLRHLPLSARGQVEPTSPVRDQLREPTPRSVRLCEDDQLFHLLQLPHANSARSWLVDSSTLRFQIEWRTVFCIARPLGVLLFAPSHPPKNGIFEHSPIAPCMDKAAPMNLAARARLLLKFEMLGTASKTTSA